MGLGRRYDQTNVTPRVTILIAARNEEEYLDFCLESIEKQTYPHDLLQVLILNDRSEDRTADIAQSYSDRLDHFSLIEVKEDRDGLKGKMNVLAQGMDHAIGDIILVTDADCRVPPDWVSSMCRYFSSETGLVGSLTHLKQLDDNRSTVFDHIQALDGLFLQTIASGAAGIGHPVSVLGNNFGFRKSAYDKIGGFRTIGFSLTEDMALLNAINQRTNYQVSYPLLPDCRIESFPPENFSDFFKQRRRWLTGGLKAPLFGWILMGTSFGAHFLILLNLILFISPLILTASMFCVITADYSLVLRITKRYKLRKLIKYFVLFEGFYIVYTLMVALSFLFLQKTKWKDREFD